MELNLAHKAPEHLPAWGTSSMLVKALMVFSLLFGVEAAFAQEMRWNGLVGIFSATEPVRLDIGTAAVKQNVPASHNSWATRLVLRRLDGPSAGPVSAAHVVGIFSEDGKYRLDIGTAAMKQNIPASHESWATRLRILRLDGMNSGAVSYGEVVGIFSEDGRFRLDIGTDAMKQNIPASHESWATRLQVRSLEAASTAATASPAPQAAAAGLADLLVGQYENNRYNQGGKNDWHYVSITKVSDSVLRWTNRANVSWTLTITPDRNVLLVGRDNPYFAQGYQQARVVWAGSTVARILGPGEEPYDREGAREQVAAERQRRWEAERQQQQAAEQQRIAFQQQQAAEQQRLALEQQQRMESERRAAADREAAAARQRAAAERASQEASARRSQPIIDDRGQPYYLHVKTGSGQGAGATAKFVTVVIAFQNGFKHRQTLDAWTLANSAWSSAKLDMTLFSKYGSPTLVRFENRGYSASGDSWQLEQVLLSTSPTPQSAGDQFEFNTWINTGAFAERGR